MTFPSLSGSPTALSLSAIPLTAATIISAGVLVSVASATFAYKVYKDFEEKKHRRQIEKVNELHRLYLNKILVPGYNEIRGFPPIYKLSADKESSAAESMHMTDEEVAAIGTMLPHSTDAGLSEYREAVLSAILKLKDYYFCRKNNNDIPGGVLTYLLYMLETKCWNFEGYEYDIAYLEAISNFVNAYASIKGIENSQHFSRLQPVYAYLLTAKQALEKHKEFLSLQELVGELRDRAQENSNRLLRNFVKLIVKPAHFDFAETVAYDELKEGILRREYVHSEVGGVTFKKDHQKELSSSVFKQWIMALAKYYLQSLSPDINLKEDDLLSPTKLFGFANTARDILNETHPRKKKLKTKKQVKAQLEEIREVFKNSSNFITTKLDSTKKISKFVAVTSRNELIDRTEVLANFAKLIHELISLQYLCAHLLKSIGQLGEIYVKNPHHFYDIFKILDKLCMRIVQRSRDVIQAFSAIQKENHNIMRLEREELLPKSIHALVESTSITILRLGEHIKNYRNTVTDVRKITNVEAANYEMLSVAQLVSKLYAEIPDSPIMVADEHGAKLKPIDSKTEPKITPPSTTPQGPVIDKNKKEEPKLDPKPKQEPEPEPKFKNTQPPLKEENASPKELPVDILKRLMDEINSRIISISKKEPVDIKLTAYKNLANKLKIMQTKALALLNEPGKSSERLEKATSTTELTISLCQQTCDFLKLSKTERQLQTTVFSQTMHAEMADVTKKSFIDRHNNEISKFIYTNICRFGIFRTDTRKKLANVDEECKFIATITSRNH